MVLLLLSSPLAPRALGGEPAAPPTTLVYLRAPAAPRAPRPAAPAGQAARPARGGAALASARPPMAGDSRDGGGRAGPGRDGGPVLGQGLLAVLAERAAGDVLRAGLGVAVDRAVASLRARTPGQGQSVGGLASRGKPAHGGETLAQGGVGAGTSAAPLWVAQLGGAPPAAPGPGSCLSEAQIQRVMGRIHKRVRSCYEGELARRPLLAGELTTRLTVDATGEVRAAAISAATFTAPALERCLLEQTRAQRFPACEGGGPAEIIYPWRFQPARRRPYH